MSLPLDLFYLAIALQAFVLALVLVPVAERFGRRSGFMDAPDPRKIHSEPKVRCGGVGIYAAFCLALGLDLALAAMLRESTLVPEALRAYLGNVRFVGHKLAALMLGATILFVTGLIDDRKHLPPTVKLALQIVSAVPLVFA